jgi:hypothetical protein
MVTFFTYFVYEKIHPDFEKVQYNIFAGTTASKTSLSKSFYLSEIPTVISVTSEQACSWEGGATLISPDFSLRWQNQEKIKFFPGL